MRLSPLWPSIFVQTQTNLLKNYFSAILIVLVVVGCRSGAGEKKVVDDSLEYYPPTPVAIDKAEFRRYYRELSNFFDTSLLKTGFNGGILIAKDGNIIYEKYQGLANQRKKDSMTATTPLHIASTSKTFTATAILRLIQENRLSLNDTITNFFPGLPYPGITVQMLLTHRSGLPNYLYFMSNNKWGILPDGKWNKQLASNEDMLQMLIDKKPDKVSSPNSRFNYCNTNYVLLAMIVEKVTGKKFPVYMQDYFFGPLQMKNSYVFTLKDTLTATPSYTNKGVNWEYDFLDATYGDKNIYTTPQDLLKWDQALYTDQVIRKSLLDSAFAPYSLEKPSVHNYGLGWRLQLLPNGKKVVYHFGKWHGCNAAFARLIDEKVTIIILGNRFNRSIYHAAQRSYDIFGEYMQTAVPESDEIDSLKQVLLKPEKKKSEKKK